MSTPHNDDLLERLERAHPRFVDLQFVDIQGMVKSVTLSINRFKQGLGVSEWFDGSAIEGLSRVSETDTYLRPDETTVAVVPWTDEGERMARVLCDVYTPKGEPFEGDPRAVLRQVMGAAAEAGLHFTTSPEMEFFLFEQPSGLGVEPVPRDAAGYFDRASDRDHHLRDDIVRHLEAMGIDVEASHHEVAPGQHEIDLAANSALASADAVVTLRWVARAMAQRRNLHVSFMPKPVNGLSGSGMHVHQGLRGPDGEDLFHDPGQPYGLSKIAQHFIAGQLRHAKALAAVLAPLVNSYKRLVAGYEAPVHITWARANRSALIRVPESAPGSATRVELRLPDASCNPYLAFAVMLGAGLDGIDQELPLPEPVEEHPQLLFDPARQHRFNVGVLPANLADAVRELEDDAVIAGILGPHILERMVETQRMDWENYRMQVTPWELKRYLPVY